MKAGETMQKSARARRKVTRVVQKSAQVKQPGLLILRILFVLLVTIAATIGSFLLVTIAMIRAMQIKGTSKDIREFNKRTWNPLTLQIAGDRTGIYAKVKHVGRHSGKAYETPVVARPLDDNFVIPLPYGDDVDWCRNVMAAGSCKLVYMEHEYTLEKPEIVSGEDVLKAFPFMTRLVFAGGGINKYLLLHQPAPVTEEVPTTV